MRRRFLDSTMVGLHPRLGADRRDLERILRHKSMLLKQAAGRLDDDGAHVGRLEHEADRRRRDHRPGARRPGGSPGAGGGSRVQRAGAWWRRTARLRPAVAADGLAGARSPRRTTRSAVRSASSAPIGTISTSPSTAFPRDARVARGSALALALRLAAHRLVTERAGGAGAAARRRLLRARSGAERRALQHLPPGQVVLTTAGPLPEPAHPDGCSAPSGASWSGESRGSGQRPVSDSEPSRCATASTRSCDRCAEPARTLAGVFGRWEEAVGPQIAAHAAGIADGRTALVDVDHPTWATQLRFLEQDLLARLRDVAGADEVTSIELRVRPRADAHRYRRVSRRRGSGASFRLSTHLLGRLVTIVKGLERTWESRKGHVRAASTRIPILKGRALAKDVSPATTHYDAPAIQVLEGLDPVRKRPGMYIGSTGLAGLHHLIWEVVDNSVDEAMAGYCSKIVVTLQADGGCRVDDDGRGVPVDPYPSGPHKGKSSVEVVLTVLHAGGKFGGAGYKVSGGLHGVGVSVVNALGAPRGRGRPRRLPLPPGVREGRQAQGKLERIGPTPARRTSGTTVVFWPDPTVFSSEGTEFHARTVLERLQTMAFLNKGLEIHFVDERPDKQQRVTYVYKGGIVDFVKHLNVSKEALFSKVASFTATEDDQELDIALQWNTGYYEGIHGYANGISTTGRHARGGLPRGAHDGRQQVRPLAQPVAGEGENLLGEDIQEGLTAIISVKLKDPQFEGQTKAKLGNVPPARWCSG